MSIKIQLDEHTVEDYKAIKLLKDLGFTDEEIQSKYDKQKEIDGDMKRTETFVEESGGDDYAETTNHRFNRNPNQCLH